jgi:type IV pilus assembly protein PilC
MLAATIAIAAAATIAGFILAPAVGYLAAILILGAFPLLSHLAGMIRQRRAAMTLAYLEQAARLNLPLSTMLRAAQQSERGMLHARLAGLRDLIDSGYPVGMALESAVPEVTMRQSSIIEAGERVGQLPLSLSRVVGEYTQQNRRENTADAAFQRAYPMVMLVAICSAASIFCIYVVPKYEQIFKDFGTRLPPMTQFLLDIARTVGPEVILLLVLAYVLISSGASLWRAFHPFQLAPGGAIMRTRDYLAWFTPVLHGIERDRGLADVFQLLHDALSTGVPADKALTEAGQLGINAALAMRIHAWAARVTVGETLADGARNASLPAIVVGMLAAARTGETVIDVCGFLARYYRTRFSRTAAIVQGVHIPVIVLIFGLLVAFVALSMFLPLISLIQNISGGGRHWVL